MARAVRRDTEQPESRGRGGGARAFATASPPRLDPPNELLGTWRKLSSAEKAGLAVVLGALTLFAAAATVALLALGDALCGAWLVRGSGDGRAGGRAGAPSARRSRRRRCRPLSPPRFA